MKTKYTVALAMAASFALGVLAVQGLHAQAKPAGYVVVEVAVTDKDGYAKEFIPHFRSGGRNTIDRVALCPGLSRLAFETFRAK